MGSDGDGTSRTGASSAPVAAPFGSWNSSLGADVLAAATIRFGQIALAGGSIFWFRSDRHYRASRYPQPRHAFRDFFAAFGFGVTTLAPGHKSFGRRKTILDRSGRKVSDSQTKEAAMKANWRTLWQHEDIVVYRNEVEVDRLHAASIERVFFVYRGRGDSPGDIAQSIVELAGDDGYALFEPNTGFAGRVNFERQAFWKKRSCVYWVAAPAASLPWRLRFGVWRGDGSSRAFRRLAREELAGCIDQWQHEGPQTWEERKNRRIERARPFGDAGRAHA